ncbi:hypothetical protein E2C01_045215 [Portunus trituberculatus]|uniref:Uncharacterized protein n=1 Tax=Portunus trituberculatus TaxID=210409 RepID=A0A5B7FV56_PORTR|nr:hypothetical protein [Portunus trituberculatus]
MRRDPGAPTTHKEEQERGRRNGEQGGGEGGRGGGSGGDGGVMSVVTGKSEVPVEKTVLGDSVERDGGGGRGGGGGGGRGSRKGVRVRWQEGVVQKELEEEEEEEEEFFEDVMGVMEEQRQGESPPSYFLMETLI